MPYADRDRQRRAQRECFAARRQSWLASPAGNFGACVDCGATGAAAQIQLDHFGPAGPLGTHRLWSRHAFREEALVTEPRCFRCHVRVGIARGQLLKGAKLDASDVAAIRLMADRMSTQALADCFGVSPSTIRAAVRRSTWAFIDERATDMFEAAKEVGLVA